MPDPIEDLRRAARLNRESAEAMLPGVAESMAQILELAAKDLEMCDRQNSVDPDNSGKTRILPMSFTGPAVKLARAILRE